MFLRERTAFPVVLYGLYLAFLGLSFRAVSSALRPFVLCGCLEVGSESYTPVDVGFSLFLVDETAVMIVWMAYEPFSRRILGLWLSWTRKFLKTLVRLYGRNPVWRDGAPWYSDACKRLKLEHYMYNGPIQ